MKLNKILCLVLSVIMVMSMVSLPAFAAGEPRTIFVKANYDEVYADGTVTVTVHADGENLYGAEWELTYDESKFQLVGEKPNEFYIVTDNTPISPDTVLATYTFKAIAQVTEVTDTFDIADGAIAQTRFEAADNSYVAPDIQSTDVTILLIPGLDTELTIDGDLATGDTAAFPYKDEGYEVKLNPVLNGADFDADVEVKVNSEAADPENLKFTEVGDYVIEYTTTKIGYVADSETYTLVIKEATFDVTATFDGEEIGLNETKAITYDDNEHTFVVESDPTATIEVKLDGVVTPMEQLKFKETGVYNITYEISRHGFTTVTGSLNLTINENILNVTPEFDGTAVELNDSKEMTFDGNEHTFSIESDPTATIEAKVGGVATPVDQLKFRLPGTYNITYSVTRNGYTTVNGTYDLTINEDTLDVTVKFDDTAVNPGETKEITFDADEHTVTIDTDDDATIVVTVNGVVTPIEELSFTEVKDYVINYVIIKEGFTTVDETVTLKVVAPLYFVEIAHDYIANNSGSKTLVLVYTNSDKVSFTYGADSLTMYDVTSKNYAYAGDEEFTKTAETKVYATVVNNITSSSDDDYKNKVKIVYSPVDSQYVITLTEGLEFDLNGSGAVDLSDPVAAYATYWVDETYYSTRMDIVLKTDFNSDKAVRGADTKAFVDAFKAVKAGE